MFDRYIDIFDGGPTVTAPNRPTSAPSAKRAPRRSARSAMAAEPDDAGRDRRLKDFRACCASVKKLARQGVRSIREAAELLEIEVGDTVHDGRALMALREINFDGIVGPSHNYAGLSLGNLASTRNAGARLAAARGGAAGHRQDARQPRTRTRAGHFPAASRGPTARGWPSSARTIERAEPALAANAMSASAMWAANAATVSPAPDTADGNCHLTVANLRTMPHRSHEWPATLAQLRLAFASGRTSRSTARSRRHSATKARPITCGWRGTHGEPGVEIFVYGVSGGAFPARQHVEASKAIARRHRARSRADDLRRAVRAGDRGGRVPQ